MQFLTYFNALGHLETRDPLQQLSASLCYTAAGSKYLDKHIDPLKYRWQRKTDFDFQDICQTIRSIQIHHHTY